MALTPYLTSSLTPANWYSGIQGVSKYNEPAETVAATNSLAQYQRSRAEKEIAGQQQAGENYRAGLALQGQLAPLQFRQQRFDQLFPYLQGMLGNQNAMTPGGYTSPPPAISTNNPWSQTMQNQAVNSARAYGDRATGTRMKQMQQGLAARGYSPNSALAQQLGGQAQAAGLANNMAQTRGINNEYAQRRADQTYRTNQLQNQQWGMGEDFDIRRRTPVLGQQSQLLTALLGM